MNKIGFCEWCFPKKGPQVIEKIAAIGANCIQIDDHGGKRGGYILTDPDMQEKYLEYSEKYGVEIVSLGANAFGKSGELISGNIDESFETMKVYLGICRDMGIKNIMLPYFWRSFLKEKENDNRTFDNAIKLMRKAAPIAEEYDVTLALETVLSADKALRMVKEVGSKKVKVFYDIQNTWFFNDADPVEEMKYFGTDNISMIHIKDGSKNYIGGAELGKGRANVSRSVTAIKNIGYNGSLIIENIYGDAPLVDLSNSPYDIAKEDFKTLKLMLG